MENQIELINLNRENNKNNRKKFLLLNLFSKIFFIFYLYTLNYFFLFFSFFFSIFDIISTLYYFGPFLVGIGYYFSFQKFQFIYLIEPDPFIPNSTDFNYFWILLIFSIVFWIFLFLILVGTNDFFMEYSLIFIFLHIGEFILFLKGYSLVSKVSSENVKNILLDDVESFKELPEIATIENPTGIDESKVQLEE